MQRRLRTTPRRTGTTGREHVALVRACYASSILSGVKTVEVRLSKHRIAPFGRVGVGDLVHIKAVGGKFVATAIVGAVDQHEGLTPAGVRRLARLYSDAACAPSEFWVERAHARFATMVTLVEPQPADAGPDYPRSRSAWHVVAGPEADARSARVA